MTPNGKPHEAFWIKVDHDTGQRIAKKLGLSAFAVYWGLACYRPNVFPSLQLLADDLGMSRAAVKRWVVALEAEKFISRCQTAGTRTTYILCDDTFNGGSEMNHLPDAVVQIRAGGRSFSARRVVHFWNKKKTRRKKQLRSAQTTFASIQIFPPGTTTIRAIRLGKLLPPPSIRFFLNWSHDREGMKRRPSLTVDRRSGPTDWRRARRSGPDG